MMNELMIREAVMSVQNIVLDNMEARIITQCIYPTNSLVRVSVRGGTDTFIVSDDGGAIREASGAGLDVKTVDRAISAMVRAQGLKAQNGSIISPQVPYDGLGAAVALVANASKEVADWCFSTFKLRKSRNFKKMLADLMGRTFGNELKQSYPVIGGSNKRHSFEYAILSSNSVILVDSVTRDAASINSRVVSNLDVRQRKDDRFEQFIVYDDEDDWPSSDLMLLNMSASIVPFSSAEGATLSWSHKHAHRGHR